MRTLKTRFGFILVASLAASLVQAETVSVRIIDAATGEPIPDAVIELSGTASQPVTPVNAIVDQVDKEFVPPVTVVPLGSRIRFPNSDDILHHVYSFSPAKTFDIPLYGKNDSDSFGSTFDTAGVVEIGCNIHDWMLAYIYVAQSDYAAKSDASGVASLQDLAPGSYSVKVWHARQQDPDSPLQTIQVNPGVDTALSLQIELGRERRIRRAPSSTRNRYR